MLIRRRLILCALLSTPGAVPAILRAQNQNPDPRPVTIVVARDSNAWMNRFSGAVGAVQMRPVGEFRQYVGLSYGVDGNVLFRLDHDGAIALRADLAWIDYGEESHRTALSETVGGRVQVDVNTTNQILVFGVGPQVTMPRGAIRPYTGATLGLTHFFTVSDVKGDYDQGTIASTTNYRATKLAWTSNAGLYVPLRYGVTPILLDVGVTYVASGRLSYLRPGGIVDLPNGQIALNTVTSSTRFLACRIALKFGR